VLNIPVTSNGQAGQHAITTDTAVSQDLGVIGRDIRTVSNGATLTLPVAQGGLLYVERFRLTRLHDALVVSPLDWGGDMYTTNSSTPHRRRRADRAVSGPVPARPRPDRAH